MSSPTTKKANQIIAFTWSPRPSMQRNNPQEGLAQHLDVLRNIRLCCKKYEIHPEFFANGGLHYHGHLELFDKVKWFKKVLPTFKMYGLVVIKTQVDPNWFTYIRKESIMTNQVINFDKDDNGGINLNLVRIDKKLKAPVELAKSNFITERVTIKPQDNLTSSDSSESESNKYKNDFHNLKLRTFI